MQYLLTQQEYDKLQNEAARGRELPNDAELQKLCTKIADTMPVVVEYRDKPSPWGCILTRRRGEWYCDECPVKTICPNKEKQYSK